MANVASPDRITSVDDLSHEFPPDVLRYDVRYFLGLTVNELMIIAMPTVLLVTFLGIIGLGVGLVGGFLAVKRFESLGNRRVPEYLWARLIHQLKDARKSVVLPLVMPQGEEQIVIQTWDGEELARTGGTE